MELQGFVQRLALHLTSWQATTFLIGEYVEGELRDNPVFTVADGLFWLYQSVERNSIVRKMQIMKIRGQESVPGMHTFRITDDGLQTFPRTFGLSRRKEGTSRARGAFPPASPSSTRCWAAASPKARACSWPARPARASPPSACSSSTRASSRASRASSPSSRSCPSEHVQRAKMFGIDFDTPQKDGKLKLIYLRPLDLSVDETVHEIVNAVKEIGCQAAGDRLAGRLRDGAGPRLPRGLPRIALPHDRRPHPPGRDHHQHRRDRGGLHLDGPVASSPSRSWPTTSCGMRYVSINGQFRKMLMVVKMRRSKHSIDMHEYQITSEGVVIGEPLRGYRGLTSGIPEPWSHESGQNDPDLRADSPADTKKESPPRPRKRGKRGRRSK